MTTQLARYATIHWLRFPDIPAPDRLGALSQPAGACGWMFGSDGALSPEGGRLPSEVWGGVALYPDLAAAGAALDAPEAFLPCLADVLESWHALLQPVVHRGECNFVDAAAPGLLFEPRTPDPGGPLFVMTTVGFVPGSQGLRERAVDFRRNVDSVRASLRDMPGLINGQVFAQLTPRLDGATMTLWADDASMTSAMYRPGLHRTQMERYKREATADRTSFTRLRVMRAAGQWGGRCPLEQARGAGGAA